MSLDTDLPLPALRPLEQRIGHEFRRPDLLRQALVHGSYVNEHESAALRSNDRLEFLGDAVLGSIVARELFERFPNAGEGWLTEARSLVVRNQNLGAIAAQLDLGSHLLMGAGVDNEGARRRPVVLARTLEAVIGAVWLDGGQRAVQKVVRRLVRPSINALSPDRLQRDPKSLLQQRAQGTIGATPRYATVESSGPAHDPCFRVEVNINGEVVGEGRGPSKRAAEMAAAECALAAFNPTDQEHR